MRRSPLSLIAALLCTLALPAVALVSGTRPAAADEGWRQDFGSLSHYTGLTCPDRIGALERFEVAGTTATMLASCTYRAGEIYVVVQLWEQGHLKHVLEDYRNRFKRIGFKQVAGTSVTSRGLTFVVGHDGKMQRRETIWPLSIGQRGLILWMNYAHPVDNETIMMAYTDMVDLLRTMK
ncbi:hypothetical protein [Breoghania sp.]|uniref:hypothetical protein n=1 Tax=Breoghania sp. TaxID=2065378 RepID=UPI00261866A0|nr:hypothetical protein [Breoghania sp.]MDJ0932118.1 hypothetical protein [Breoghania sp.]